MCACCASCCESLFPQPAPRSALGGSTLRELWSVGQNGWLPPRALEHVQGAKAGALGQLVYKPVVLLEQPGSYRSQNPGLRLFPEGRASTLLSVSKKTLPLCLVSGTKRSGQRTHWILGSQSGHLELLSMTEPQWRGRCPWPQLVWCWETTGP